MAVAQTLRKVNLVPQGYVFETLKSCEFQFLSKVSLGP